MFNFGLSELLVIGVLALIFIGPKQLPQVARTVGRLLNEFKRATGDITGSFVKMRDDTSSVIQKTQDKIMDEVHTATDFSADDSKAKQANNPTKVPTSVNGSEKKEDA